MKKRSKKEAARKNPVSVVRHRVKKVHRRRRNPGNVIQRGTDYIKMGLAVIAGLFATQQIPQLILGGKNKGGLGYASNILTTLAAGAAASKMISRQVGYLVGAGGAAYVVSRFASENLTPIGKALSLSGVGDAQAAGLGRVREAYFPYPPVVENGVPQIPAAIRDARPVSVPAPPAAQMAGYRFGRR